MFTRNVDVGLVLGGFVNKEYDIFTIVLAANALFNVIVTLVLLTTHPVATTTDCIQTPSLIIPTCEGIVIVILEPLFKGLANWMANE